LPARAEGPPPSECRHEPTDRSQGECRSGALAVGLDGDIGVVVDMLLDAEWRLRYLVVDTQHSLGRGRALISLQALALPGSGPVLSTVHRFAVSLTCGQITASMRGGAVSPSHADEPLANADLRRSQRLLGCEVHASDGPIGHLQDLVFDDRTWSTRGLVVKTRSIWPGGRRVLVGAAHILGVARGTHAVQIALTREQVRASASFGDVDSIASGDARVSAFPAAPERLAA